MKKIIINEKSIGLLFKNGRFSRVLKAGKYIELKNHCIEIISLEEPLSSRYISLEGSMEKKEISNLFNLHVVNQNQILVRYLDGRIKGAYGCGEYAFYNGFKNEKIEYYSTEETMIKNMSADLIKQLPVNMYVRHEIGSFEKGLLFIDNKYEGLLDSGIYYFWKNGKKTEIKTIETRLVTMGIGGQELLTLDKVTVRVNLAVTYRVVDYVMALTEVDDYCEQIRLCACLALRDYIGKSKLDEILDNKEEISRHVYEKLKEKENVLYVEIKEAGIKDIILPGEIRSIMNTILLAEKKAQANVITRREEVASTRSLLNTAKLMDENKTLYKLKELEYLERICENVGNINLNGNGDVISQLHNLLKNNA